MNTPLGLKFPFESTDNEYFVLNTTTKEQLKSDINVLIIHSLGDRYMMPYYGLNLMQYIFEPITDDLIAKLQTEIKTTLQRFIFGIKVDAVNIIVDELNNCLGVQIQYTVGDNFVSEQDFTEVIF